MVNLAKFLFIPCKFDIRLTFSLDAIMELFKPGAVPACGQRTPGFFQSASVCVCVSVCAPKAINNWWRDLGFI